MIDEKYMRMNLQYFAEDTPPVDDDTGDDPNAGNDDPEAGADKTVSVAEMKRRLEKEEEKQQAQLKALQDSFDTKLAEAVEKAKNEAKLTGKELQEYKEKEAERKMDELRAENQRLQQDSVKRELKDEAIKTLSEKGMTVNEKVLDFVVKDTAEATLEAIDAMAELFKVQKEEFAQTDPPRTSGGLGAPKDTKSRKDILSKAKITDF